MTWAPEAAARTRSGDGSSPGAGVRPAGLDELRDLLLGREKTQLARLEERIENPALRAEDVGRVLPQAFARSAHEGDGLARAMAPAVEAALQASIRRDPTPLTNAIFPVIGPAIRKAIADAFSRLVQSFNHALEHSLSPRGLGWRWEAWRTGRPFAEVVLCHTLVFRVEQMLLVHRPTGLLLLHANAPEVQAANEDVISAMLSAIQDFMRDSFHAGPAEHLQTVRFGEWNLWVETGPHAMLAAVVRGQPPPEFQLTLERTVEAIHREEANALQAFKGGAASFESLRPRLEECLQSQTTQPRRAGASPATVVVAALVLIALLGWGVHTWRERAKGRALVGALRAEPGLVITETTRAGGKLRIAGLRDPLAADPGAHVQRVGLRADAVEFRWQPFVALSAELTLQRARTRLTPPAGVELALRDGVLVFSGTAPEAWWREARTEARLVPGVQGVEAVALRVGESEVAGLAALRDAVARAAIFFERGRTASATPETVATLGELAKAAKDLRELARARGAQAALVIAGHSDPAGTAEFNARLRRQRAEWVRQQLIAAEVAPDFLRLEEATGALVPPASENSTDRCVTFTVWWQR